MPMMLLPIHICITLLIIGVGWLLRYLIGMGSIKRRVFITPICWWAAISYFMSLFLASSAGIDSDGGWLIFSMGSLVFGIFIGIIHGTIAMNFSSSQNSAQ
jgi:hypothetical protein